MVYCKLFMTLFHFSIFSYFSYSKREFSSSFIPFSVWLFSTKINQIFLLEPKKDFFFFPFCLAIHWYMSLQKREENVERRSFGSRVASTHKKDDPISSLSRLTFGFAMLRKLAITDAIRTFFTKCQSQWWWSKTPHKLLSFLAFDTYMLSDTFIYEGKPSKIF